MTYDHLVHIDEGRRELQIFRVSSGGEKSLYTAISLPAGNDEVELKRFMRMLGENLLLDSVEARTLLGL